MPRWATWLPLLCTAATACSALASRPQDAPQHKGHARSLLHGVHAADAPEEYLDHLAADGKDPSTYLIELLQGNATATDSISSEQLTSLLWFLKGHLKVIVQAGGSKEEAHQESAGSLVARYGEGGRLRAEGLRLAAAAIIACITDVSCTLGSEGERPAFLLSGEGLAALPPSSAPAPPSYAWLKWLGAGLLFLEAMLGVCIPLLSRCLRLNSSTAHRGLSLLNSFAGGVFLAFGVMHLAPEAFETQRAVYKGPYPLAGLFIAAGFYLFFSLQKVLAPVLASAEPSRPGAPEPSCCIALVPLPEARLKGVEEGEASSEADSTSQTQPQKQGAAGKASRFWSFLSPVLLMLALCVHAAFEGLTLGLQTGKAGVVTVLVAMVSHKWVESVALTTRFLRAGERCWWEMVVLLFPFAIVVPVGVAIGIALTSINAWVTLVLFGLISGMFIFVGGYEIIAEEFAGPAHGQKVLRVCMFGAMMLGFALVALLQLVHDS